MQVHGYTISSLQTRIIKTLKTYILGLKIIDVKQPEGDQRVYRTSTYDLTTDEISKVKQAFINANRDAITFAEGDISVTNTPNGANVSTVTVNINKGRLTKSFTSNLANMNFLRWVNFHKIILYLGQMRKSLVDQLMVVYHGLMIINH